MARKFNQQACLMIQNKLSYITRFAPSPTGYLHLGHAYSALEAWRIAGETSNNFLLRIDDLDHTRCRKEYEQAIFQDLEFLGINWKLPVLKQSERLARYQQALDFLQQKGYVYACFLSRKAHAETLSAPHHPPTFVPSSRHLISDDERQERLQRGEQAVWRLDTHRIIEDYGMKYWHDLSGDTHPASAAQCGDVIIGRRDIPYSYHLSVVLDDADSAIECVVRGEDLLSSTPVHVILQTALNLPTPLYHHHKLIVDDTGNRLAKRHNALSLRNLKQQNKSKMDILTQINELGQ